MRTSLSCATHRDDLTPVAAAFFEAPSPLRHGAGGPEGAQLRAWSVVALRPFDRDHYPPLLSDFLGNRGSASTQLGRIAHLLRHRGLVGPGLKRAVSQNARGDSKTPMQLFCRRCHYGLTATPRKLAEEAERLQARRGVRRSPVPLIAYLADKGEVLSHRDNHAEKLARRDEKASDKARRGARGARRDATVGARAADEHDAIADRFADMFDVLRLFVADVVDDAAADEVCAGVTAPVVEALAAVATPVHDALGAPVGAPAMNHSLAGSRQG